ncbi:MAG: hypothetical protein USCGTAYLOR_02415 [Chromatiales bacterium USCg_Taylor]|nr:MAG: hypothetical protein USCGTAYLOR_02415 [Chromatiales bacterium USCg_Taylor]
MIDRFKKSVAIVPMTHLRCRRQRIGTVFDDLAIPFESVCGWHSNQRLVERRAKAVDIGPRALQFAVAVVDLDRREAWGGMLGRRACRFEESTGPRIEPR